MFYNGYFIVLDIVSKEIEEFGKRKYISVCLIMNDKGKSSWISSHVLKIECALNNE